MATVYGILREDKATYGEKVVLKLLRENLPKEFAIYVECPLQDQRQLRYPDFIISTNYGVIVLEVKDWITIEKADKFGAHIRTRENKKRKEGNPVDRAREFALLLSQELLRVSKTHAGRNLKNVPWGYAVVLPNLPTSVITQLRTAWGNEFVLNRDDLAPGRITSRLKSTLPLDKIRDLRKIELDYIRATINPTVFIEQPDKPAVILDEEQEKIVSEPVRTPEIPEPSKEEEPLQQMALLEEEIPQMEISKTEPASLDYERVISQNTSIRLVRGVAGSGKTLVIIQRARYLATMFPEWDIAVLTFNNALCRHLEAVFKGTRIKAMTFHSLCRRLLLGYREWNPQNPSEWLEEHAEDQPIIGELSPDFIEDEFKWIKDVGLVNRKSYYDTERKGRGKQKRLSQRQREQVYDTLLAYQTYLKNKNSIDWADIPHITLRGIVSDKIHPERFQAVLVDEAQDFAPIWFRVVEKVLDPDGGLLFLADDPVQSIYRFFSWRQKGIHVVGRTRRLKIPYRNTYEIYVAAYTLVKNDELLQQSLEEEGRVVAPDLSSHAMRHGQRPLLQRFRSFEDEVTFMRSAIYNLLQEGMDSRQIAVLHRRSSGVKRLQESLKGLDISINTMHSYKGLEFDVVFLSQVQETFQRGDSIEELSEERRLVYMAMTRARQQLFLNYQGTMPVPMRSILEHVDSISN